MYRSMLSGHVIHSVDGPGHEGRDGMLASRGIRRLDMVNQTSEPVGN